MRPFWEEAKRGLIQVALRWGFRSIDGVTASALVMKLRGDKGTFVECFFQNEEGVSSDIRNKGNGLDWNVGIVGELDGKGDYEVYLKVNFRIALWGSRALDI